MTSSHASVSTAASSSSAAGLSFSEALSKSMVAGSSWPDKEAFLDSLYWLRQVLGVVLGLAFGALALRGAPALVLYGACSAGAGYVYCVPFHGVDEEEYGGVWELTKEGFMTSFAGFLVTWIIVYSGMHFE